MAAIKGVWICEGSLSWSRPIQLHQLSVKQFPGLYPRLKLGVQSSFAATLPIICSEISGCAIFLVALLPQPAPYLAASG
jgi:hypothetical protein